MAFNFAQLAYRVWGDLGKITQFDEFVATGGSASTIIDTKIAGRRTVPPDDYYIDYTAIVVRDAGGASAAPENEVRRVSDFVSSTSTFTVSPDFSVSPAVGDTIAVVNPDIPLQEMFRICNRALLSLGDIGLQNTSLTTTASQTEYTLPEGLTRDNLADVLIQTNLGDSNDNQYVPIRYFDVKPPTTIGSTGILEIPQETVGYTLQVLYNGSHDVLTAGSSVISKSINPELAIAAAMVHAIRYLNRSAEGDDKYWLGQEQQAMMELDIARARFPIWKWPRRRGFGLRFDPLRSHRYIGDQSYYDR